MGRIQAISHITLLCRDIEKSANLFCELLEAQVVYSSDAKNFSIAKEKFLLIDDLWIALMEGDSIQRSYNHIAFRIDEEDLPWFETKLEELGLDRLPSRPRHEREGKSLYFCDFDNHLFELHTGDLATRLSYYHEKKSHCNRC